MRSVYNKVCAIAAFTTLMTIGSRCAVAEWQIGDPIVTTWGLGLPNLTNAIANYANVGGFNVVGVTNPSELNTAQAHGLRAMYWNSRLLSPAAINDPVLRPQLDAVVSQLRDHPAMYAYMVADEPHASQFPGLSDVVDYLRTNDPGHLAYINLFPVSASSTQLGAGNYASYLNQYINTVDPSQVSSDYYQFRTTTDAPLYFQNLAALSGAARNADVPFLNIVQGNAHDQGYRVPNANELRFLNYTNLAYGAQGIMYWTGVNSSNTGPEPMPVSVYNALTSLNREFVSIASELQSTQSIGAFHLGDRPPGTTRLTEEPPFFLESDIPNSVYEYEAPVKGVVIGLFGSGPLISDSTTALAVNLDYVNHKTVTVVGPEDLAIFDPNTKSWSPTGGTTATLNLLPGGGILVGLASVHVAVLPGDYNDDGVVNAADYTLWRNSVGVVSSLPNDLIRGVVGDAHYDQWRSNFGNVANDNGSGASAEKSSTAVPEPTHFVTFAAGILTIAIVLRHRAFNAK